jgi:N-sulfoglucosamine sulfohydrolase
MTSPSRHAPRPNVLWISLEDTSPRFGCYGDRIARTPNLDRLAADGARFPSAFAVAGVCAPSRCTIITGMYATSVGGHQMRTSHHNPHTPELPTPYQAVLPHYAKCFSEYLRAAGYYCTNNDKTDYQFGTPITAWDECSKRGHWRNREPGQPFFAVFNLTVSHESGMWADKGEPRTDPAAVTLPPYLPDTLECRKALARQYDHIADNDAIVGRLLRELEDDGLAEDTAVFIWSDHGEGLPRAKRWPYDAGIRVPLIVRWPGRVAAGTVDEQLVSLVDLAPTVLSICGVEPPRHLHARAFVGPRAGETPPREYVFAARDRHDEFYDMVRAARDRRFKYIRHWYPQQPYLLWNDYRNKHPVMQDLHRLHVAGELRGPQALLMQSSRPPEELYDTQSDPWEINNLAADPAHRATLDRLRAAMDDWRATYGDMGEMSEIEMVERMWPGRKQPTTAAPLLIPIGPDHSGMEPANDGGTFAGPLLVQMHCATQGASITYTTDPADAASPRWRLYARPLRLEPASKTRLRAKAIRYGYAESPERAATFAVT